MVEELHPDVTRHLRRNFILGVANGGIFSLGDALQDTNLVLSVFVNRLSGSNVLVGFLQPVRLGGWFLLQLLLSARVQGARDKLPYYRVGATIRSASAVALAIAAWMVRDQGLLLPLMFLFLATFSLAGGLSGIAFTEVVAKTIPSRMRGSFFAWRMFTGGVLALAGSFLVRYMLDDSRQATFPRNYAVLFTLAALAISISMAAFGFVKEPTDGTSQPRVGIGAQLRRARSLPSQNPSFRNFLLARIFIMLAEIASPFYIIYAKSALGLPTAIAGTYLIVSTVSNIASTYLWGQVSDRIGNRAVIRLVCLLGGMAPLLALAAAPINRHWGGSPGLTVVTLGLVFVLLGVSRTGMNMGGMTFLLDVAPANDRTIYIGFTNTLVGIASLVTILGGVVVDALGYVVLFSLAVVLYVAAGVAITGAAEPRRD